MTADVLALRALRITTNGTDPRTLVDGVDLTVAAGDRIGIVGDSGSGKSLTLLAGVGLLPAAVSRSGGEVEIDGRRLGELSQADLARVRARRVALLPQGAVSSLSPTWTVGAQLEEVVRLHRGTSRRDAGRDAAELLRMVAIDRPEELLGAWPHQISGGQAQRVVLALALAGRPAVLLADEPTTGLDGPTAARLLAVLDTVCAEHGLGLVVVSHDLAVVAACADRVLVMFDGRVLEEGPVVEILTRPRHPYTRRLVAAAAGNADPSPVDASVPRDGCRWAPRCALRRPACLRAEPELLTVGPTHRARCPVTADEGGVR